MSNVMKAPEVKRYIRWLGDVGYRYLDCSFTYDDKTYELLDELFSTLGRVKPTGENNAWRLWLRADRGSIEDYGDYKELLNDGEVENYQEFEQRWLSEYPEEVEWFEFQALYEEGLNYRAIFLHHKFVIEQDAHKERGEENDISDFVQWLLDAVKEAVADLEAGTYNDIVNRTLPPKHRTGTVLRKYEWEVWPNSRETMLGDLTEEQLAELIKYADESLTHGKALLSTMTANDFFRFCAMGYKANNYKGTEKSPREQYYLHADGRDDGLRDIDPDSPDAFAEWYNTRNKSGHPWEVCRGGNSTHVSLYVHQADGGWYLSIAGSAWTRSLESMKFFLALHQAGIPVCVSEAETLKKRVLGEEKIGIVPSGVFPAYCNSFFPGEDVIDFMNLPYDEPDRTWFITHSVWQPVEQAELNVESQNK